MRKKSPGLFSFRNILIVLIVIAVVVFAIIQAQLLLSHASGVPADIVVQTDFTQGVLKPSWFSFAQGGEESKDMIAPVISETKALTPRYIRIDHLYDFYSVVSRADDGSLTFDFSRLDAAVKSILATGAQPFLSLSYMPSAISSGDILSVPRDWNEWALVVERTIEHYSGTNGMNLQNVYYEVWNEPDLFGNWRIGGPKDYTQLYSYAAAGASRAQNVNPFKLGGPATTQLLKDWIVGFADFVSQNHTRIDFFSWHRYTSDPTQFAKDISDVTNWLFYYPTLIPLPRVISEWGFDPANNSGYDGNFAAAHAVATVRQVINGYDQLFAFEIVDGPDPNGQKYWGRWGLLTNPAHDSSEKPRYSAFTLLQKMHGQRLLVSGEGSWVTGFAAKDGSTISMILSNYDVYGRNTEAVPVTFTKLLDGSYTLVTTRLNQAPTTQNAITSSGTITTRVLMLPNTVVTLELTPVASQSGH